MNLDSKTITTLGTAAAILVAAATAGAAWLGGYVQFQTVDCAECTVQLAVANERLGNAEVRIAANETAIEACTTALEGTP